MINKLLDNAKWNINRQFYSYLLGKTTTVECMLDNILCNSAELRLTNGDCQVDCNAVMYALNDISINNCYNNKYIRHLYDKYWNMYVSASKKLSHVMLPKSGKKVRLVSLIDNYIRCSQLLLSDMQYNYYKDICKNNLQLTAQEVALFDAVFMLGKCKYFCGACRFSRGGDNRYLCNLMPIADLAMECDKPDYYSNTSYVGDNCQSVVDCFGNSAVMLGEVKLDSSVNCAVTANGRSVMDTFCYHRFGSDNSLFFSRTPTMQCYMQYALRDNCEIRNYRLISQTSNSQKFSLLLNCGINGTKSADCRQFDLNGVCCYQLSTESQCYLSYVLMADDNKLSVNNFELEVGNNGIMATINHCLSKGQECCFSVVAIFADSIKQLSDSILATSNIGFCRLGFSENNKSEGNKLNIVTCATPCSNLFLPSRGINSNNVYKYCYRFGDASLSTMLDNDGNSTSLLDGFLFGVGGESIYSISNNVVKQVNIGKFSLLDDGFSQCCDGVTTVVRHHNAKSIFLSSENVTGVLVVLPFEEKSSVTQRENLFVVSSASRKWAVAFNSTLTSFTTNSMECNNSKLRNKLSGDIVTGTCLAMYFANVTSLELEITNINKLPISHAVIDDSVLAICLDHYNQANIYNAVNRLKPVTALQLASMVYTNSKFVKQYLMYLEQNGNHVTGKSSYYNGDLTIATHCDKFMYCLALLQYSAISDDMSLLTDERVKHLIAAVSVSAINPYDECIRSLCLAKMAQLDIDKVNTLVLYSRVERKLKGDKESYSLAQAVGCVEIMAISKERIKHLVEVNKLPKCWYYVSQLDHLYGINVVGNKLIVKPNVASDSLEKLLINVSDKKLSAVFNKSSAYSIKVDDLLWRSGVDLSKICVGSHDMVINY